MEVFRICKAIHSTKLTASGSANRWNNRGQQVIYTGSSRSLSTLELVVHKASIIPTIDYSVMIVSIADEDHFVKQIQVKELPANWRSLAAYAALQAIGSKWYTEQQSLVLKVPSAIITHEYNYIINTEHADFIKNVQLVRVEDYFWDRRLV